MTEPLPKRAWAIGVHYRRELHRYLARRLKRRQDIDDLTQEVFLRLLRVDHTDCVREPLAYLYGIAAHVVADFSISERQQAHVTADSQVVEDWANDPSQALPDDMADRMSAQRQLEAALKRLPPLQAAVLVLHYQDGLYCSEIAQKLGLSPKSIDKYLTRAKAKMHSLLWDW